MSKKTKIILMTIFLIIITVIIGTFIIVNQHKTAERVPESEQSKSTKTSQLYDKILNEKEMTLTKILDEDNKIFIAIKDNKGYKEVTLNGNTEKYIVKDGNTYYLDEFNEKYYKYQSNDTIITEVKEQFQALCNNSFLKGKESIEGKNYKYEEVSGFQDFLFNYELAVNDLEFAKTRLYYDGENLKYVKTTVGDNNELLEIKISFKGVKDNYFEIPESYSNGEE